MTESEAPEAAATAPPGAAAAGRPSCRVRLLPHRRQAGNTDCRVTSAAAAHPPLPPLSRHELLQLLQLQAPLQVWGEFFSKGEKRWIACVFRGPEQSVYDAADILAGRKAPTQPPAAAGAAAQEALQLQFLRCCCLVEQRRLDELKQRQQQQQELQRQQQREETEIQPEMSRSLTSGLLLSAKPRRRAVAASSSDSNSISSDSGTETDFDATETPFQAPNEITSRLQDERACSSSPSPAASAAAVAAGAIAPASRAAAGATAARHPAARASLRCPLYWEAGRWGLLFLRPGHLSLFVLPMQQRQLLLNRQRHVLQSPLLRTLLWRLQAKTANPPPQLQQLMIDVADAADSEPCAPCRRSSNDSATSGLVEKHAAPHELAEEAALIADAFAAAWKPNNSSRKRARVSVQGTKDAAANSSSSVSSNKRRAAPPLGGHERLGAAFLQTCRQGKGGLQQMQGAFRQQPQQQQVSEKHKVVPLPTAGAVVIGAFGQTELVGAAPCSTQGPHQKQHQQGVSALEQQGRAAVRFVLAVDPCGALKDVTHRYVTRQVSCASPPQQLLHFNGKQLEHHSQSRQFSIYRHKRAERQIDRLASPPHSCTEKHALRDPLLQTLRQLTNLAF